MSNLSKNTASEEFERFVAIVKRLRLECPWDKEQTHESLAAPLIEEAYETVQAIEENDISDLRKELGDLLLHVVFHAVIGEEQDEFSLTEVIRSETEKLIYRHPHIFQDAVVTSGEDVKRNWEQLKRAETGRTSILDGVPTAMPALQRATRLQERAATVGFDWPTEAGVLDKIKEEFDEFSHATEAHEKEDEFGDILFSLVNYSRHQKIDAERALRKAADKFDARFRIVEKNVEASGNAWQSYSLEDLDRFWNEAKQIERS